jgi:SAM-dependent methyltransferase
MTIKTTSKMCKNLCSPLGKFQFFKRFRYFLFFLVFVVNIAGVEKIVPNSVVFSDIYERGEWGVDENQKGNSGTGSDPRNARPYISFLKNYLEDHAIKSVVDLGCGDWRLGQQINWNGITYIGIDVVESVVSENIKHFGTANISFVKADVTEYMLPKADLLICKDVLQHLPYKDIHNVVKQLNKYKHCIVVNDVDPIKLTCENVDIPRGHYRCLDLTQPPFSLCGRKVLTYASGDETKQILVIRNKNK